jgi:predicted anti-sigma-YlaC factor YlaD
MDSEAVERLMDIVLQMQINLAQVTQTLQQQTCEMRQQLQVIFENEQKALDDCLVRIDEKLNECSVCIEAYRRGYSSLETMRYKLVQLGAEPAPMPAALPEDGIDRIIQWRLNELRSQGRVV